MRNQRQEGERAIKDQNDISHTVNRKGTGEYTFSRIIGISTVDLLEIPHRKIELLCNILELSSFQYFQCFDFL